MIDETETQREGPYIMIYIFHTTSHDTIDECVQKIGQTLEDMRRVNQM